jgi:hypothetical protein
VVASARAQPRASLIDDWELSLPRLRVLADELAGNSPDHRLSDLRPQSRVLPDGGTAAIGLIPSLLGACR